MPDRPIQEKNRRAFTLIELLIVIAIVLILIAIALPNFLEAQARAKVTRERSDIRTIATAIEALRTERDVLLVDFWDDDESRIRHNRFGAGDCQSNGFFAQEFPTFWACCCWHATNRRQGTTGLFTALTTPIPYLTSVPEDPFSFEQGDLDLVPNDLLPPLSYMYHDNERKDTLMINRSHHGVFGCYRPGNCLPGTHGIQKPLSEDHYLLIGFGPDQVRNDNSPTPYNPTNGTISWGDVIYRSDGGV